MRWGGRGVKRKSSKQAAAAGAAARPVCVCMLAVDVCRLIRAARSVGCGRLPRVYLKKFCRHPGDGVGWGARLLGEAERRRPQEPTQTGTATTNNRSSGEPAAPAAAPPHRDHTRTCCCCRRPPAGHQQEQQRRQQDSPSSPPAHLDHVRVGDDFVSKPDQVQGQQHCSRSAGNGWQACGG